MVGIHSRGADIINPICYPFIQACGNGIKNFEIVAISKLVDMLLQFNIWEKFIDDGTFITFHYVNPELMKTYHEKYNN